MSGTNTRPRHTSGRLRSKSRNRVTPTSCGDPPRAASAFALSSAQTTIPHIRSPQGSARTWTLPLGFDQTPNDRSGVLAAAVDDAAKAASTAILFHFTRPDTLSLMIWRPPSLPGFARLPLLTLMHAARICLVHDVRSEEHTSELQSLMRISYAVIGLK